MNNYGQKFYFGQNQHKMLIVEFYMLRMYLHHCTKNIYSQN